jgi:Methionyl-tRNA formyltransferase
MVTSAPLRIGFFGTPEFAVPTLQKLIDSRHDVVAVVSQPDRPKGRGQKEQPTPTKVTAEAAGIAVLQPVRIREDEFLGAVRAMRLDRGVVAAYVWDYADGMQLIRFFWDAAVALDPSAAVLDEGQRFSICRPAGLGALLRDAGLHGVATRAIDVPTHFRDFDDCWQPFLGGQGPAPSYAMSLPEEHRTALRERLRAEIPAGADGSIDLVARAWAVRGVRG